MMFGRPAVLAAWRQGAALRHRLACSQAIIQKIIEASNIWRITLTKKVYKQVSGCARMLLAAMGVLLRWQSGVFTFEQ